MTDFTLGTRTKFNHFPNVGKMVLWIFTCV